MASKKQNPRFDVRQSILMVYVGICVVAVALTVVIAFGEASSAGSNTQPTPTLTRTLSPLILTQQADGSVNNGARPLTTPMRSASDAVASTVTATLDADEH